MTFCVIYDDVFVRHRVSRYHPENPGRITSIVDHLRRLNLFDTFVVRPARADVNDVLLVHERSYVDRVLELCGRGEELFIDSDTYLCPDTCRAAITAAGAVVTGVERVMAGDLKSFYAIVRPPGHHSGIRGIALNAPSQGFCIFNNVAVGARYALARGAKRVAIVDVDAHHGNGTQEIFYDTSRVLYISTHQDPLTLYPGTGFVDEVGRGDGEGFNVNIPLPPGTGDDDYIDIFDGIVMNVLDQYKPDLVLVSLGFDAHARDAIAELRLSLNSYEHVFRSVMELARRKGVRGVGFVLEGGYDFDVLARGSEILVKMIAGLEYKVGDDRTETRISAKTRVRELTRRLREVLSRYWKVA